MAQEFVQWRALLLTVLHLSLQLLESQSVSYLYNYLFAFKLCV
jgi:hypothetical protein